MAICDYNCTALGDHERLSCEKKFGGFDAFAVVECDHEITDWTNATQWNTEIAADRITLVKGIKGMFPEPSAIENESLIGCGRQNEVDSYDRTFTWRDGNVSQDNIDFYNSLKPRHTYIVGYNCTEDEIWVNDFSKTDWNIRLMGPENKTEKSHFLGTAAWVDLDDVDIYTAPAGIFDN